MSSRNNDLPEGYRTEAMVPEQLKIECPFWRKRGVKPFHKPSRPPS
jgi:hypothetical protein